MNTPTRTVTLPYTHANDWRSRYDGEGVDVVRVTARTITLTLDAAALTDLVEDSRYYARYMRGELTDGVDYATAAKRCLARLTREGLAR